MSRVTLALILLTALAIRLVNAFLLPGQAGDLILSDMKGYDRAALALLRQEPLAVHTAERYLFHPLGSDTYHPPGYYYFLAAVYASFGHSYLAVRIVQAVLGTLTCLLIYLIGKSVLGEAAGKLAAAVAAIYPPLIFYTGVLLTETLSTFSLAAATWIVLRASREPTWRYRRLVLAGLFLGLSALTRSVLLIVVPVVFFWLMLFAERWPGWTKALRSGVALCVPLALVILPVTLRNYQIHREFVLISTNGGVNFFLGHGGNNNWKNAIRNIPDDYQEGEPLVGVSDRTATEEEAYFYELGWAYIRLQPLRTLRTLPAKFCKMYWETNYWPASGAQADFLRSVTRIFWGVLLLPLSLLGLVFTLLRSHRATAEPTAKTAWLLYGIIFCSALIPLIFWAQTRFRVPFVPYFIVLAAGTAVELYRRLRPT